MRPNKILLTCEHADYQVPSFLSGHFSIDQAFLKSHRGWDKGALEITQHLCQNLNAKMHFFSTSRLVIDANRRLDNGALSLLSKTLPVKLQKQVTAEYEKYRKKIIQAAKNRQLAFSIHTFTPVYKSKRRKTDIGILFRSKNSKELKLAQALKRELIKNSQGKLRIHFNLPYRGHTDCLLNDVLDTYPKTLNGLFLEINQRLLNHPPTLLKTAKLLEQSLRALP